MSEEVDKQVTNRKKS